MRVTIEPGIGGETPHALYHLYGAENVVLYIGIAGNPEARFTKHAREQPWWPEVTGRTVDGWYPSRAKAAEAEAAAIRAERPVYNLSGLEPHLRGPGRVPELPQWSADELAGITDQIAQILARRDISHAHARLRALNLLLAGRDELPHGSELAALAMMCGMSGRAGYKALALERGGWPEGWRADAS